MLKCNVQGLPPLVEAVQEEEEDHMKAAAAWTIGQIGRHTPDHAKVRNYSAKNCARANF